MNKGMSWVHEGAGQTRYWRGKFKVNAYHHSGKTIVFLCSRSGKVFDTESWPEDRERAYQWAKQRLEEKNSTCQWFLGCENPATTGLEHPILGRVPICQRCSEWYNKQGGKAA